MSSFAAFVRDQSGATAIEYGLLATLISVAILAMLNSVGSHLNTTFDEIATQLK